MNDLQLDYLFDHHFQSLRIVKFWGCSLNGVCGTCDGLWSGQTHLESSVERNRANSEVRSWIPGEMMREERRTWSPPQTNWESKTHIIVADKCFYCACLYNINGNNCDFLGDGEYFFSLLRNVQSTFLHCYHFLVQLNKISYLVVLTFLIFNQQKTTNSFLQCVNFDSSSCHIIFCKPVEMLYLNSMTRSASQESFSSLWVPSVRMWWTFSLHTHTNTHISVN